MIMANEGPQFVGMGLESFELSAGAGVAVGAGADEAGAEAEPADALAAAAMRATWRDIWFRTEE